MPRIALIAMLAIGALTPLAKAEAAVTFDPDTGTGYVAAGVIAASLGWTPEQRQEDATALGLVLAEELHLTALCNGVPAAHITDRTDFILEIAEQRDDGTVQGFIPNDFGRAVGRSSLPTVGSDCGEGPSVFPRVWTSVEEEDREDRLYVVYQGFQVLIWPGSTPGILREPVDERGTISSP